MKVTGPPLFKRLISLNSSSNCIANDNLYSAHNYAPLPVVLSRGQGCKVWDVEGKEYYDFVSGISSVNQGHSHPAIVEAFVNQAETLSITSRAVHNDKFGEYAQFITEFFGMEMILPTNTGAEAIETAMKMARSWAYKSKGVADGKAIILAAQGNYHGRTIATISMSTDPSARNGYGPFLERVGAICPFNPSEFAIPFNNESVLERAFKKHGNQVAAFIVEPIQGEGGIIVPSDGYLSKVSSLCKKHNVLLICDEIQTGLGRTGKLSAHEYDGIKPDLMTLGKSLSGGMYPVSCVIGRRDVMLSIEPGTHGSTFGGNPLHSAVAIASLKVIRDEKLTENAFIQGERLRKALLSLESPIVTNIRGRGLLNAMTIDESRMKKGTSTWDLCLQLRNLGLITRPTKGNIIRLIPPLCLSKTQVDECVDIISHGLKSFE